MFAVRGRAQRFVPARFDMKGQRGTLRCGDRLSLQRLGVYEPLLCTVKSGIIQGVSIGAIEEE